MELRAAESRRDAITATPLVRYATEGRPVRAAAGSLALRVASLGLGFICHLLLTRLLRAHGYGLYAYALAWMKALSVPATLGLERLLVREVATYHARSDWASWRGLLIWARRTLLAASAGIALVAVAATCAALVCGAALLERALPASVKEAAPNAQPRVWMRSVVPLLLVSGVNSVSGQIPVLMLGALRNAEAAGIMSVAKRLSDLTI